MKYEIINNIGRKICFETSFEIQSKYNLGFQY